MSLRESVRHIAEQAGRQHNCRLYDIYSHRDRFQVFIDRPQTSEMDLKEELKPVSLQDCEQVSYSLSFLLQSHFPDFFKKWKLEVSTPGLDRKLREKWHFSEALGQEVKIIAHEPVTAVNSQTKREWETLSFSGQLHSFKEDILTLNRDCIYLEVPFLQIKSAQVVFLLPQLVNQVKQSRRKKTKAKKSGKRSSR